MIAVHQSGFFNNNSLSFELSQVETQHAGSHGNLNEISFGGRLELQFDCIAWHENTIRTICIQEATKQHKSHHEHTVRQS